MLHLSAAGPAPPFNERPRSETPFTPYEIFQVISAASDAAEKTGYGCYLFGSAAVHFTCPNSRLPGDIDLVVYRLPGCGNSNSPIDAEQVKVDIQMKDPRFYRVVAKTPGAKYTPFWFSFSYSSQAPYFGHSIKVDIVSVDSEDLRVPVVPVRFLESVYVVPTTTEFRHTRRPIHILPPFALLLMKLKGWHDNRASAKHWIRSKTRTDVIDIYNLLTLIEGRHYTLTSRNHRWFPPWLIEQGRAHARDFLLNHFDIGRSPAELDRWVNLGLVDPHDECWSAL